MQTDHLLKQLAPAMPNASQVMFVQQQAAMGVPSYSQYLQRQNSGMVSPSASIPAGTKAPRIDNWPIADSSHALFPVGAVRYAAPRAGSIVKF
jgi:hypothetical protein